jgi:hypothetical protein
MKFCFAELYLLISTVVVKVPYVLVTGRDEDPPLVEPDVIPSVSFYCFPTLNLKESFFSDTKEYPEKSRLFSVLFSFLGIDLYL